MSEKFESKATDRPLITVAPAEDSEKVPSPVITGISDDIEHDLKDEPQYDFATEEFASIPELVRNVVGFEDDPTQLVITFRSIILSAIFCVIGSIVSQLSYFRTTTATFPVFFVILASAPMGRFMARVLPDYKVPLGCFSFSLNPGPFSTKEHAIIGIAANAGSQGQWATYLPTNAALYYGITMNPAVALFFGWGASLLGFSFAAAVRKILVDDPEFIFPLSLQQVTVYRSMQGKTELHSQVANQKMKVFWLILLGVFIWQFLPEFLFPMVAYLAPLCWFASRNHTANFLGSGKGGIGLLNITLNWSNITSTVITYPYSVQVTVFVGFVITTWILIPVAYFGNLWGSPTYDVMSNDVFQKNGSSYPTESLIYIDSSGSQQINETMYREIGLAYSGAQYTWEIFMWYASYISSIVWCGLFLGPKIANIWKARKQAGHYHKDRLSRIMQKYPGMTKCYNTAGIQYALVGPTRLFASSFFKPVRWGFMAGAAAPAVVWMLHRRFPKLHFDLWNTTIFFASAATFYGNISTGPFTMILIGTFFNFFLFRYRRAWWNKWAYIVGAAMDTGFNANLLFIFVFLGTTGVAMVAWWGNNSDSVERCFAL